MKEKVDKLVTETLENLNSSLLTFIKNGKADKEGIKEIFAECFTRSFEKVGAKAKGGIETEAESEMMRIKLYWELARRLHPDSLGLEPEKVFHSDIMAYIKEKDSKSRGVLNDFLQLPQQMLGNVNAKFKKEKVEEEKPPEFLQNPAEWVFSVGKCWLVISFSDNPREVEEARCKLQKTSPVVDWIRSSMWDGLDAYFQPIRFLVNTIAWIYLIIATIGVGLSLIALLIAANIIVRLPKLIISKLVSIFTGDEFERQIKAHEEEIREKIYEEHKQSIAKQLRKIIPGVSQEDVDAFAAENPPWPGLVKLKIDTALENGLLYLQIIWLAFSRSLFRDISQDSWGKIAGFIITWPFRLIAAVILFSLATIFEAVRIVFSAIICSLLTVASASFMALLFVLNLPRYIFYEVPCAIGNAIYNLFTPEKKSDNSTKPDNAPDSSNKPRVYLPSTGERTDLDQQSSQEKPKEVFSKEEKRVNTSAKTSQSDINSDANSDDSSYKEVTTNKPGNQ
jgi:hypothetical protein